MNLIYKDKFSLILIIISILMGILSRNYVNNILFICCYVFMVYRTDIKDNYDKLFYTLIIASIFEYTLFFPYIDKLHFFHILLLMFTVINLYKLYKKEIKINLDKKIFGFYILWFVYILISSIWANNKYLSIKFIIIYAIVFLFMINIILYVNNYKRLENLISTIEIVFILSLILGLLAIMFRIQLPVKHYYDEFTQYKLSSKVIAEVSKRPIAFFYNPNNFGSFITMFLPLFIYKAITNSRRKRLKYIFYSFFAVGILLLTTSRFNIVALVAMVVLGVVYTISNSKHRKKGLIYSLCLIIILSFMLILPAITGKNLGYINKIKSVQESIVDIKNNNAIGKKGSENIRLTLYYDVIKGVLEEKNLFGFGVGNISEYIKGLNNTHKTYNPHGWFFEILGDFGVCIFIFYVVYLIYIFKRLSNIKKYKNRDIVMAARCIILSLVGFILGSFSPSSITYFLPHWLLFGIIVSFLEINECREVEK